MEKRLPLPAGTLLQQRYRIMRQLGHGGFGAVYEAVDDEIGKSFALKETFYAANEELRQAFKREARMLASLEHDAFPNVSHYFTEGDGCFLVMELVRGDDLDKLLSERSAPFEPEQVLAWAEQILDALQDLHSGGIVHRDIKPSNLKLTPKGRIKLLDFGIAKGALEEDTTVLTTVGSLAAATLQYAPLEQILKASPQHQMMLSVVSHEKVIETLQQGTTAASDLYALAATLYQLLTKQLPVDAATRAISIWSGKNDPLIPAHRINPHVSNDVSEVLTKAMQLERGERLQTAAEMRRLLKEAVTPVETVKAQSVVADQFAPTVPILPSTHVSEKVTQPDPRPVVEETVRIIPAPNEGPRFPKQPKEKQKANHKWMYAVAAGLCLLLTVVLIGYFVATRNRRSSNIAVSNANTNSNSVKTLVGTKYELAQTLKGGNVSSLAFSADGQTLASGGSNGGMVLWDVAKGVEREMVREPSNTWVRSVAFSPDGKTVVSGSYSKDLKLWDAANGALKLTFSPVQKSDVNAVAFSPDGKTIASGSADFTIKLWDAASGSLKIDISSNLVHSVAFSPDGKTIAAGTQNDTVELREAASGTLKATLTGHSKPVYSVTFSPDGKTIASASVDQTIKLWNAASGALIQTLTGHGSIVNSVAFSPDGKILASGSSDKTIKLWDVASGTLIETLTGHSDLVTAVAFSPDGKTLASGSTDGAIRLWRAQV